MKQNKKNRTKLAICAFALAGATLNLTSCMDNKNSNPFFREYKTPHATAPFDKIKMEHYEPALMEGIKQHEAEVDAIINNTDAPTFENTIEALEYAGSTLNRVSHIFYNLLEANTSEEMQNIAEEITPLTTEFSMYVSLNESLFQRVKQIYDQKNLLKLNAEETRLLEKTYESFARNGANLDGEGPGALRKIPQEDLQQLQKIFDHTGATRRIDTINRHSMEKAKEMGLTPEEYFRHVFNNSEKEHLNE